MDCAAINGPDVRCSDAARRAQRGTGRSLCRETTDRGTSGRSIPGTRQRATAPSRCGGVTRLPRGDRAEAGAQLAARRGDGRRRWGGRPSQTQLPRFARARPAEALPASVRRRSSRYRRTRPRGGARAIGPAPCSAGRLRSPRAGSARENCPAFASSLACCSCRACRRRAFEAATPWPGW